MTTSGKRIIVRTGASNRGLCTINEVPEIIVRGEIDRAGGFLAR
ncbi:MAG TPA: hypothetical protein VF852_17655 [Pseudolabrys sp.]